MVAAVRERDDPRWSIGAMWETVQIELQVALQEVLFSASNATVHTLKLSNSTHSLKRTSVTGAGAGGAGGGGTVGATPAMELSFSFDDSNAPSIARMSRGKEEKTAMELQLERRVKAAAQKAESLAIVTPSPYNITVIYRPCLAFTQQVQALISPPSSPTPSSPPASQLMGFLATFLTSSFLPRLQADVNIEVDSIFADAHAFDAIEAPHALTRAFGHPSASKGSAVTSSPPAPTPLRLRCVLSIAGLLSTLLSHTTSLPHSSSDYTQLLATVVSRLLTATHDRYTEATRGVYSASRMLDTQLRQAMMAEPAFVEVIQGKRRGGGGAGKAVAGDADPPSSPSSSLFSPSHPLYAPFFAAEFGLRHEQLLTDPRALADVCLIGESVEWLADHLYAQALTVMREADKKGGVGGRKGGGKEVGAGGGKKDRSKTHSRSHTSTSLLSASALASPLTSSSHPPPFPSFRLDEAQAVEEVARLPSGSSASTLCTALLPLCSSLTSLSTLTLLTLRFDFHCQLFASLSSLRSSSYNLPTKPTEPEPFILTLIAHLSSHDDTLTRLTHPTVRLYVQRDVSALTAALVVRMVGQLQDRRVTREGGGAAACGSIRAAPAAHRGQGGGGGGGGRGGCGCAG